MCALGRRYLRRAIGGVVIANDEFCFPTALVKRSPRTVHRAQGGWQQLLFVKCRNDDGDFHCRTVNRSITASAQSFPRVFPFSRPCFLPASDALQRSVRAATLGRCARATFLPPANDSSPPRNGAVHPQEH